MEPKTPKVNPYDVLNLPRDAQSPDVIKRAYHARILKCRPDERGNRYTPEFYLVMECYNYLMYHATKRLKTGNLSSGFLSKPSQRRQAQKPSSSAPKLPPPPPPPEFTNTKNSNSKNPALNEMWLDPNYRRSVLPGDTLDPIAFESTLPSRIEPRQYTTADIPTPKQILRGRSFDNKTFNALFEYSKNQTGGGIDTTHTGGSIDGYDAYGDLKKMACQVAECDGLMMVRTDVPPEMEGFVDLSTFEKQAMASQVYAIDEVDPTTLTQYTWTGEAPVTKQEELTYKSKLDTQWTTDNSLPATYDQGANLMYNRRLSDIEMERERSREYINRYLNVYPEDTRLSYGRGSLEQFVSK